MENCPCGSEKSYELCCAPLHALEKKAATAEELMRSRYCAFVKCDVDYIIDTHHPSTRQELDRNEITTWAGESEWMGLEVIDTTQGQAHDSKGEVEFKASYKVAGKDIVHHERSQFLKEDGSWYFYDGKTFNQVVQRTAPKIGRNDPCHCGSGKKFKKCCLSLA